MENKANFIASDVFSTQALVATVVVILSAIMAVYFFPMPARAEEDNGGDFNGFGEESIGFAASLGWISIGAGVLANVPFVLYMQVKRTSVVTLGGGHEITRGLARQHQAVLNFHMIMNIIGFTTGMAHGILLIRGLDSISLSLAITMTVLVASGIGIRLSKKSTKNFARLLHGQAILSGLLILLVFLHVVSMHGFD